MPGYYKLMARKSSFNDATKNVTLQKNETEMVSINMEMIALPSTGRNRAWNWITTVLAIGGGAVAAYYYGDSKSNYEKYGAATTSETAKGLRSKTESSSKIFNITFSASVIALVLSVILWFAN
jgi:hypothetical protein